MARKFANIGGAEQLLDAHLELAKTKATRDAWSKLQLFAFPLGRGACHQRTTVERSLT